MLASENCTKIIVVIILLYLYFRTGLSPKREREEFFAEDLFTLILYFVHLSNIVARAHQAVLAC
jgi:hypothetical protein